MRATTSLDASHFAYELHGENSTMPAYRMGDTPQEQLRNIVSYVTSRSGCDSVEAPADLSLEAATNWMLSQPKGTIFTVYVAGTVDGKETYHFLNAVHMDNIMYIDFQTNRGPRVTGRGHEYEPYLGHLGPATSDNPFVGIITQQYASSTNDMHAQVQEGSFDKETARLTIAAFL